MLLHFYLTYIQTYFLFILYIFEKPTFIQQWCIKLIKTYSNDFYIVTKYFCLKQMLFV